MILFKYSTYMYSTCSYCNVTNEQIYDRQKELSLHVHVHVCHYCYTATHFVNVTFVKTKFYFLPLLGFLSLETNP